MKFSDFAYQRPNMDALKHQFSQLLQDFQAAESATQQNIIIQKINRLRSDFDSMMNIAYIRYSSDTTNADYEAEQAFFDNSTPILGDLTTQFYTALLNSRFKSELEQRWGQQFFALANLALKTFKPEIIPDLKRENQLISAYTKLKASAKIIFDGAERNLSEMYPYQTVADRAMRKAATNAKWQFFVDNAKEFDQIFDELVKIRHQIATKLGYDNFVKVGYYRMQRTDYDAEMVAQFRQQVKEQIVPLATKLRKRQAKRLAINDLKHYDLSLTFKTGNARPKGSPDWIVNGGKRMYEELSAETGEFFNFMLDKNLMDLVSRKGKSGGGYCTYISNQQSPYIFSNFNGTSGDITVLTHEAGHAFQCYMSRNYELPEYHWPTSEAAEIHSMAMEFLTWPWMHYFFKEDTEKFKFEHLSGAILFLPYGVAVDEFQHYVYENPEATPQMRKQAWRDLERKYLPSTDYDGNDFLEKGGYWQAQSHIYASPFYYIDYTLAQICAFQLWTKSEENRDTTFADYLRLCKAGGSQSFLRLVEQANLRSPFQEGCLADVIQPVASYLDAVDDMAL